MSAAIVLALGLLLVIEGLLYVLVPAGMKRLMKDMIERRDEELQIAGAVAFVLGFIVVFMVRHYTV
jgi:uncharacterized protein